MHEELQVVQWYIARCRFKWNVYYYSMPFEMQYSEFDKNRENLYKHPSLKIH